MQFHGVTGTQTPSSGAQQLVEVWLMGLNPMRERIVVGCCIGMDAIIGRTAHTRGFYVIGVVPANRYKVASDYREWCDEIIYMPAGSSFMDRNDEIVRISTVLTGFPRTLREELRSGTWATIRRGWKKFGIQNVHIIPVGSA